MRNIKFRAWDINEKRMMPSFTMFDISDVGIQGWPSHIVFMKDHYDLMEYTGRKDKNKQELYESDIIKCNSYDEHGNAGKIIGEIYWDQSECAWAIYSRHSEVGMGTKKGLFLSWAKNIELLGNKYQNPDLQEDY